MTRTKQTQRRGFKPASKKRDADGSDDEQTTSKKAKVGAGNDDDEESAPLIPELKKDDNGDAFVTLNANGKRRVTVSSFKNQTLVSIREYWTDDSGELKPGKKGISLTAEQYSILLAAAPLLEGALAEKGIKVARPDYDGSIEKSNADDGVGGTEDGVGVKDEDDDEE